VEIPPEPLTTVKRRQSRQGTMVEEPPQPPPVTVVAASRDASNHKNTLSIRLEIPPEPLSKDGRAVTEPRWRNHLNSCPPRLSSRRATLRIDRRRCREHENTLFRRRGGAIFDNDAPPVSADLFADGENARQNSLQCCHRAPYGFSRVEKEVEMLVIRYQCERRRRRANLADPAHVLGWWRCIAADMVELCPDPHLEVSASSG